jgi:hypothetical protein
MTTASGGCLIRRLLGSSLYVMPDEIGAGAKETLRALTILVGMISVVSFVQRLFDVGVIAVAKTLIQYYREIAHLVFAAPMELLGIKVPPALTDAWTLSFVGASAYARTPRIELSRFFRRHPQLTGTKYWKVGLLFLFRHNWYGPIRAAWRCHTEHLCR